MSQRPGGVTANEMVVIVQAVCQVLYRVHRRWSEVAESGRSPPDFLGMSIRIGGLYRLAKPFKPNDLVDLIAEILASPPRAGGLPQQTLTASGR